MESKKHLLFIQQLEAELRRQRLELDPNLASSTTISSVYSRRSQHMTPAGSQYDLNLLFGDQTSTVFWSSNYVFRLVFVAAALCPVCMAWWLQMISAQFDSCTATVGNLFTWFRVIIPKDVIPMDSYSGEQDFNDEFTPKYQKMTKNNRKYPNPNHVIVSTLTLSHNPNPSPNPNPEPYLPEPNLLE